MVISGVIASMTMRTFRIIAATVPVLVMVRFCPPCDVTIYVHVPPPSVSPSVPVYDVCSRMRPSACSAHASARARAWEDCYPAKLARIESIPLSNKNTATESPTAPTMITAISETNPRGGTGTVLPHACRCGECFCIVVFMAAFSMYARERK